MQTVKISCGNDMRLLSLGQDITFNELVEEINKLGHTQKFVIKYKDNEGDMITVTTDKELKEAFSYAAGSALKLELVDAEKREPYKKLKELVLKLVLPSVQEAKRTLVQVEGTMALEAAPVPELNGTEDSVQETNPCEESNLYDELETFDEEEEEQEPAVEDNRVYHKAYCNNCMQDIYNVRYKCANCDDYDLCEECEMKWNENLSMHDTTHVFLKLYYPISTSYTYKFLDNLYEAKEESETEESEDDSEDESETETEESSSSEESEESEESSEEDEDVSKTDIDSLVEELLLPESEFTPLINPESEESLNESLPASTELNVVQEENLVQTESQPVLEQPAKGESRFESLLKALQRFFIGEEGIPVPRPELLLALEAMGFQDTPRNEALLEENGDNIEAVLDQLLVKA